MKKLLLISCLALSLAACRKEYTCVCTTERNDVYKNEVEARTQSEASSQCAERSTDWGCFSIPSTCRLEGDGIAE
jgi:hypothetical protein